VVTHPLWVQEVPAPARVFMFDFFCIVVIVFLLFCPKTQYLSQNIAIPFTMLIYLVYSTYCKICDQL